MDKMPGAGGCSRRDRTFFKWMVSLGKSNFICWKITRLYWNLGVISPSPLSRLRVSCYVGWYEINKSHYQYGDYYVTMMLWATHPWRVHAQRLFKVSHLRRLAQHEYIRPIYITTWAIFPRGCDTRSGDVNSILCLYWCRRVFVCHRNWTMNSIRAIKTYFCK